MTFLVEAYVEDEAPNTKGGVDKRTVPPDPRLAPVKAAVLLLSRNADLSPKARDLAAELRRSWNVEFDDAGRSGAGTAVRTRSAPVLPHRGLRHLDDDAVTIRERDSMAQERVAIAQVGAWLGARLLGC